MLAYADSGLLPTVPASMLVAGSGLPSRYTCVSAGCWFRIAGPLYLCLCWWLVRDCQPTVPESVLVAGPGLPAPCEINAVSLQINHERLKFVMQFTISQCFFFGGHKNRLTFVGIIKKKSILSGAFINYRLMSVTLFQGCCRHINIL